MKELRRYIIDVLKKNNDPLDINAFTMKKYVLPHTPELDLLTYLISKQYITFDEFERVMNELAVRRKYCDLYKWEARSFVLTWGESHIRGLFPELIKATKRKIINRYPDFAGEFNLWSGGIRVEVKACRAYSTGADENLTQRAYLHKEAVNAGFRYRYPKLNPSCCDVFILIGVCLDELVYWVLSSEELLNHNKFVPQHRNGNAGLNSIKGRLSVTEEEMRSYCVAEQDILRTVRKKANK